MVFVFHGIPAKDHQANSYRREDGDNDDPDNWIVEVWLIGRINFLKRIRFKIIKPQVTK